MTTLLFPLISVLLTGILLTPVFVLAGWVRMPAQMCPAPVRKVFNTLNRHHI